MEIPEKYKKATLKERQQRKNSWKKDDLFWKWLLCSITSWANAVNQAILKAWTSVRIKSWCLNFKLVKQRIKLSRSRRPHTFLAPQSTNDTTVWDHIRAGAWGEGVGKLHIQAFDKLTLWRNAINLRLKLSCRQVILRRPNKEDLKDEA